MNLEEISEREETKSVSVEEMKFVTQEYIRIRKSVTIVIDFDQLIYIPMVGKQLYINNVTMLIEAFIFGTAWLKENNYGKT